MNVYLFIFWSVCICVSVCVTIVCACVNDIVLALACYLEAKQGVCASDSITLCLTHLRQVLLVNLDLECIQQTRRDPPFSTHCGTGVIRTGSSILLYTWVLNQILTLAHLVSLSIHSLQVHLLVSY